MQTGSLISWLPVRWPLRKAWSGTNTHTMHGWRPTPFSFCQDWFCFVCERHGTFFFAPPAKKKENQYGGSFFFFFFYTLGNKSVGYWAPLSRRFIQLISNFGSTILRPRTTGGKKCEFSKYYMNRVGHQH